MQRVTVFLGILLFWDASTAKVEISMGSGTAKHITQPVLIYYHCVYETKRLPE
jgi:hypothetical protein